MNPAGLSDAPLEKPEEDLLGVSRFPRKLAELIREDPGALTVGVYGSWGSGKTSFVNLVQHHLGPSFTFIKFSAWPYRTADELWRALILEIAWVVYWLPKQAPPRKPHNEPSDDDGDGPRGFLAGLRRFLNRETIVIWERSSDEPAKRKYDKLVTRLDETTYGTIAKDSGQRLSIDQEEAAMAVLKAALSSMGALSPLVAWLGGMLGSGEGRDLAGAIRREKNEAVRERIASIDRFKAIFEEVFREQRQHPHRRLCVFVDDLDRCMPDVALDLLEAIKIILSEFPWVFLVAADQELISRGLQLRYRNLAGRRSVKAEAERFETKGREYFEKIIQLHIPVPVPDEAQLRRFVGVQFPRLAPAADIILLAAGDNPRRIKQYCQWLEYKQGAFESPEEA
jgi:hypothetical protein